MGCGLWDGIVVCPRVPLFRSQVVSYTANFTTHREKPGLCPGKTSFVSTFSSLGGAIALTFRYFIFAPGSALSRASSNLRPWISINPLFQAFLGIVQLRKLHLGLPQTMRNRSLMLKWPLDLLNRGEYLF